LYADVLQKFIDEPAPTLRDWFIKRIWVEYVNAGSTRKLAAATGINHNTIAKTLQKFKRIINERVQHCYN
jgi:DNA-binding transcriptional regulator YhcF (GntR family)